MKKYKFNNISNNQKWEYVRLVSNSEMKKKNQLMAFKKKLAKKIKETINSLKSLITSIKHCVH